VTPIARADNRHFSVVYEAETSKEGELEYEQSTTYARRTFEDPKYNALIFRHELEYGITDKWKGSLYLPNWEIRSGELIDDDGAHFDGAAVETIYQLTDPRTEWLGTALYGEISVGPEEVEFEPKLILQKNLGLFTFAYNISPEAEWEGENLGHLNDHNLVLVQSAGASYELSPAWSIGLETEYTIEWSDWSHPKDDQLLVGPNVAWRHDRFWATLTPMYGVVRNEETPEFQVRLLFGIEF
jgi:hypothetical protein